MLAEKNRITTAESYRKASTLALHVDLRRRAQKDGVVWGQKIPIADREPIQPFINYGRWVIQCPDCRSVEFLDESGLFMCSSCWNKSEKYHFIRVKITTKRERIEEIMLLRPDINKRNWETYETIKALEEENKSHGLPIKKAKSQQAQKVKA